MKKIKIKYKDFIKNIKNKKIAISFSGGLDSCLLLKIFKKYNNKILLIHIIHNNNKNSKKISNKCIEISKKFNFKIKFGKIFANKKNIKKRGLEGAYRYLRYRKIVKICKEKKINTVLLGHNLNDLIETVFINIFRGCGINGILSMKKKFKFKNIKFVRPLLKSKRNELLKKYGKPKKIAIDITNCNKKIKRNLIRYNLKKISHNLKNYENSIYNFYKNINYCTKNLTLLAKIDLINTGLKIKKINLLNKYRFFNLIFYVFKLKKILMPSKKFLFEIYKQIRSKKNSFLIKKKKVLIYSNEKKLIIKK